MSKLHILHSTPAVFDDRQSGEDNEEEEVTEFLQLQTDLNKLKNNKNKAQTVRQNQLDMTSVILIN